MLLYGNYDAILNVDETPVYFSMQTDKTIDTRGNPEVLIRKNGQERQRLTLVAGIIKSLKQDTNDELSCRCKPMLIFKGKTNRTLTTVSEENKNDPTIVLRFQEKAWITSSLYSEYLEKCIPDEWKGKKLLLVHDNCEPHMTEQVKNKSSQLNITLFNLPPNLTFAAQPLDVCVNKSLKNGLRAKFNQFLVEKNWNGESSDLVSKNMMIEWVKQVWNEVPRELIAKSFSVCGLGVRPLSDESGNIYWRKLNVVQNELNNITLPGVRTLIDSADLFRDGTSNNSIQIHPSHVAGQ